MITTIGEIVRGDATIFPPYLYEAYRSTIRRAPHHPLVEVPLTLSELTGPGPVISAVTPEDADLTRNAGTGGEAIGQRIIVTGRVLDADGVPVRRTLVEVWQANAAGRYDHPSDPATAPLDPNFQGYATLRADAKGEWRIVTIKPGGYDSPIGHRPPHIHFDLRSGKARNIAQLYFPEEAEGNAKDLLYKDLGGGAATSIAVRDSGDPSKYRWDIVMLA